ncbi:Transposon TX1 uncharacterized [Senna tora]|uniref:Transposon TX1 uncharacterized n=1 Tax=Senna tora TaxID=362788 RepID=A0A834SL49_9FABA|nr:Transposon TX1 uncharacterized [Senna tora]
MVVDLTLGLEIGLMLRLWWIWASREMLLLGTEIPWPFVLTVWCVINEAWRHLFSEAAVVHLPNYKSDHNPLWIRMNPSNDTEAKRDRPFRFLASWVMHNDFNNVVRNSWSEGTNWSMALSDFYDKIKVWNRKTFGNIFGKKEAILTKIQNIEERLASSPNGNLKASQEKLWKEYELILDQEELLWLQKSRCQWTVNCDRNTRFYHTTTMIRRKRNKVEALMNSDGEWIYDGDTLMQMAVHYFSLLYSEDIIAHHPHWVHGHFPEVDHDSLSACSSLFSNEERDALWTRVLRAKYRAVVRNWCQVSDGIEWRVGDGKNTKLWMDAWVPNCGRLQDSVIGTIPHLELHAVVVDYTTASGGWDWARFEYLLPDDVRARIVAIRPPSNLAPPDQVAWKHSNDGRFSVKTAYRSIAGNLGPDRDALYKMIWKLRVP